MKVAICEDDQNQVAILRSYLQSWSQKQNIPLDVQEFASAESCLFAWTVEGAFDVTFLDIHLDSMTGVELARAIREVDPNTPLVFTTTSTEFILEGYDLNAMKYLLKPIKEDDLHSCLDKTFDYIASSRQNILLIKTNEEQQSIAYEEIRSFESVGHTIMLQTTAGMIKYREKIESVEHELKSDARFVRIHRSFIVNLDYVKSLENGTAILDDDSVLPVSKARWKDASAAFVAYHTKAL